MLNKVIICGRLVRDPELRHTESGTAVTSFAIAVERDFQKEQTDFINCVAWRNTAEFISKYFAKGRMILISGSLQNRSWTDKDGNKRTVSEVIADNAYFADSKEKTSEPEFNELPDNDSDLPF